MIKNLLLALAAVFFGITTVFGQDLEKKWISQSTTSNFKNLLYNNIKPTGDNWSYDNMSERYWDGRKLYVLNASSTGSKQFHCYELDLPNEKGTDITAAVSGNIANYNGRFYMSKSTPSNATIASRTYNNAPSLTVLISGVHENRS